MKGPVPYLAIAPWLWLAGCGSESGPAPTPTSTATGAGVTTTTSTTTPSGGTTTSSGSGGEGGGAAGGGAVGGGCVEVGLGEPNEKESTAFELAQDPIDDCDGSGDHVRGVIAGADDVDWFVYSGNDALWPVCIVNPTRDFDASEPDLRLCVFFQCLSGDVEIDCPGGTTPSTSPAARPGCCSNDGFEVTGLNCGGTFDEDVYVFIRVDQPGASAATCSEYLVTYHY